MDFRRLLILFLLAFSGVQAAENEPEAAVSEGTILIVVADSARELPLAFDVQKPNPLLKLFSAKQRKNKRLICAALAFPLPFGIVGLHRIYMGCAPYVPVVYIASVGGAFGILPLIDFFVLAFDKNLDRYINNPKVFMWVE